MDTKKTISDLFDSDGDFLHDTNLYFSDCGYVLNLGLIEDNYDLYHANSDIVWLYFVHKCSSATKGNYTARGIFDRIY